MVNRSDSFRSVNYERHDNERDDDQEGTVKCLSVDVERERIKATMEIRPPPAAPSTD